MSYALHGMMGTRQDWDCLDLDLLAVDLWDKNAVLDFENWAAQFNQSIKGDRDKCVIGYSMGGRLALHALLDQSSDWKAGVVISTHPGLQSESEKGLRLQDDKQWAAHAGGESEWAIFLKLWNEQAVLKSARGSRFQTDLKEIREKVALAFENWSLGRQQDLRLSLQRCQTPVLWITGERDEKFTQVAAEVVSANDNFEHVTIADAGHRLLYETGTTLKTLKTVIVDFQKRIL